MASFGRNQQGGRWLPVVLAALAWIGLVVVGAGKRTQDPLLGVSNMEIVWTILLGVSVLASLIFLIIMRPSKPEASQEENRKPGWLLLVAIAGLLWWKPDLLQNLIRQDGEDSAAGESAGVDELEVEIDEPPVETVAELTDILLILLALAMIAGVWWLARRRLEGPLDEQEQFDALRSDGFENELVEAIDEVSLELRADADPRTTVIRAYAVLEAVLARQGLRRADAETHTEHIRRVLAGLRVDAEPFAHLAGLYERARFSELPITNQEKRQAAGALETARASLATPT